MTALLLQVVTPSMPSAFPATDSLDGLDPRALSAVADALLAASERQAIAQGTAGDETAADEPAPVEQPRTGHRRGEVRAHQGQYGPRDH